MARESTIATRTRAQIADAAQAPGLRVTQPLAAGRDTSRADSWGALKGALGLGAQMYGQHVQKRDDRLSKQASADALVGHYDEEAGEHDAYANAYVAADSINTTRARLADLEVEIGEKYNDLTPEDWAAAVDGDLQKNFGALLEDDVQRRAVAPVLAEWMHGQIDQRVRLAGAQQKVAGQDAIGALVHTGINGGNLDFETTVAKFEPLLGRREAEIAYAKALAQEAIDRGDTAYIEQYFPRRDAKGNPSGYYSNPEIAGVLRGAAAKIQAAEYERNEPLRQLAIAEVDERFEGVIAAGGLITRADTDPLVAKGVIKQNDAHAWWRRSQDEYEKRQKKYQEDGLTLDTMNALGVKSELDIVGLTPQTETIDKAKKTAGDNLVAMTTAANNGVQVSGPQLAASPQLLNHAIRAGRMKRVPHPTLDGYLSNTSFSDPQSLVDRVKVVRALQAAGEFDRYVTSDADSAMYEAAVTALDDNAKPENVLTAIRDINGPEAARRASEGNPKVEKLIAGLDFKVMGDWTSTDLEDIDAASRSYAESRIGNLAKMYVRQGFQPEAAVERAKERFGKTNIPVRINGKSVFLPNTAGSAEKTKEALEWFGKELPAGHELQFSPAANGRGTEVFLLDPAGRYVGAPKTLESVVASYIKAFPKDALETAIKGQTRRKTATEMKLDPLTEYKTKYEL